ncbi:MAG: diheme cytochrome c [Thioalkalispiraceae bacterium]|jgi:hypothetical protein
MNIIRHKYLYLLVPLLGIAVAKAEVPVSNDIKATLYTEECASCHMAYPAWLLPARSWHKIMANLDSHFGDNASLDPDSLKTLTQYLLDNSADNHASRLAKKLQRKVPRSNTPMRISELPYIRHEHDEIPSRYIKHNPRVKSLSNCAACHQGAEQGSFNEHRVSIPGYGRWDD